MTNRGATAAVIAEVAKQANQPFHLAEAVFDGETVRMTDAYRNVIWNGYEYIAVGYLLEFSDIKETATLQVSEITVSLSGIDQTLVSVFLSQNYIDRSFIIYKALFDENFAIISNPIPIFEGRMDDPVIDEDPDSGKSVISVRVSNHWVDFERIPGRHTNNEEQQLHYPGDKGFEYASEIVKDIWWGRNPPK